MNRYLVKVRVLENKKRTYRIDAEDESDALKRTMTRLAPKEREGVTVDSIEPDPTFVNANEPFGVFLNDNHD